MAISMFLTRPGQNAAFWSSQLMRFYCVLTLLFLTVISTPPEDPVKCKSGNIDCTVTNSYGTFPDRETCRATAVVYPTNENELVDVVANATKAGSKMRTVTRYSHSITKLACAGGDDGILISTKSMNDIVARDLKAMTMTVESGMTLKQLVENAAEAGMALPYSPYFSGLTVGGMMGTGSHGSSLWGNGSSIHDYVVEIRIVTPGTAQDGFAKVRVLNEGSPDEFDAAKVSLGVLGVISQVTFKLEPMFKRSIKYEMKSDTDLGDEAAGLGWKHEFIDMTWFPSQGKVVYRIDDRVPSTTRGDGLYDSLMFRSKPSHITDILRTIEENQELFNDADAKCTSGKQSSFKLFEDAYGLTNDGTVFMGYPVVGNQSRLMSFGSCLQSPNDNLTTACGWDPRINGQFFHQTTFSISLLNVKNFIEDIKSLVKLEPKALCGLEGYEGIFMRYVTGSPAYLGKESDAIDFELTYYRSKDPLNPRMYEDFIEEIEQMGLFKYDALPHWGKNRNIAFDGVIKKYRNAGRFLKVKESYDPSGLFSNEWTDQILGLEGNVTIIKPGCALEGLCICSEDVHCAPEKDYFCRPGKVYKDARVCTRIVNPKSAVVTDEMPQDI